MMNKQEKSWAALCGIPAFTALVLFVVIPFRKLAASWMMLVFLLLALAAAFFAGRRALAQGASVKSKYYGIPILRVWIVYLAAQSAATLLVCALAAFLAVPAWVAVVLCVLFAGAAGIGVIAADTTRDIVQNMETRTETATVPMIRFRINTRGLSDLTPDPELKKELNRLAEDFQYSDPMSSAESAEPERQLEEAVTLLRATLPTADKATAGSEIAKIRALLEERNRICKAAKKK